MPVARPGEAVSPSAASRRGPSPGPLLRFASVAFSNYVTSAR